MKTEIPTALTTEERENIGKLIKGVEGWWSWRRTPRAMVIAATWFLAPFLALWSLGVAPERAAQVAVFPYLAGSAGVIGVGVTFSLFFRIAVHHTLSNVTAVEVSRALRECSASALRAELARRGEA